MANPVSCSRASAAAAIFLLSLGGAVRASPLRAETRVGAGAWSPATTAVSVAGEAVEIRVDAPPGAAVRWYELVPDLGRDHHNAEWPWNPGAYRWLGYEPVAVERVEIAGWRDRALVTLPAGTPPPFPPGWSEPRPWLRRRDAGTFWLQAEVTGEADVRRTPGLAESDRRGLSPATLRVSVRDGQGFLGWIGTFYNVPSVFGSTPYQSRNWLGADCADVVMTARGAWLGEPLDRDWSVAALVGALRRRAETELVLGQPERPLVWGRDVRPGDVIAVRYAGWRHYGHVGVLDGDSDGDGLLGPTDRVLHAGPLPLARSPLAEGAFDGHVVILEPGARTRARAR